MRRLVKFARSVWGCRRIRTWQMVTACWKQSDPAWWGTVRLEDVTDAEWDAYRRAVFPNQEFGEDR